MDLSGFIKKPPAEVLMLFGTLVLFLITNALFGGAGSSLNFIPVLLGALIAIEIFVLVGLEIKEGAHTHGWQHEVVDTLIALVVAVAVWYGASFLLGTSTPVSAVVSCSMLPNLQRGDFVIVQGAPAAAYEIEMTDAELKSLNDRAYLSYDDGTGARNESIDGSIFAYCVVEKERGQVGPLCQQFFTSPDTVIEKKGAFTYRYARCPVSLADGLATEPCVKSVEFRGREYLTNFSDDVIVYGPPKGDYYSRIGDIVHRVMFRITSGGKTYYLTRGDNNPILDLQAYEYGSGQMNHPIPQEQVRGKVIARVPLLGYFKLFIQGYVTEDPQCRTQLTFPHN